MVDRLVRLNLYLGREGHREMSLLKPDYLPGGDRALTPAGVRDPLPFDVVAFVERRRRTTPSWLRFLDRHFDVAGVTNVSTAFVLVFEAAGRWWALSFGTGYHAIDLGAVEPGFGLRVCANSIDPEAVRAMANRRVGAITRQQLTHISRGSRVAELGVVLDHDWVRYLAGRSAARDLTGSLAGADALTLTSDVVLEDLPNLCERALDRFEADDYRDGFGFIDQLRPLRLGEPIVDVLNAEIERRILARDATDLHLAPTDMPDDARLNGYRIWAARKSMDIAERDIQSLYTALDVLPVVDSHLDQVRVAPLGDDGSPGSRDPLRRYLVAELTRPEGLFVHSLGSWFKIDTDYAKSITRQVASLEDATDVLQLPPWTRTSDGEYDETSYNVDIADERGWVLLDGRRVFHGGPHQQVEICDLLTDDDEHICVKRAESSATLSHLFNQAAVTCALYRSDPEFRRKAVAKLESVAPGRKFPDLASPRFVYAIGTTKPGPLAESLFFFSKLALVANATELQGRGAQVALARIEMQ
jgi:uncharacterized protein (TIGR04141 family)